jgi:deoxycytidine triphosphate deaminase
MWMLSKKNKTVNVLCTNCDSVNEESVCKYEDPRPTSKGLLLSDEIQFLCTQHKLLIANGFREERLRPAAYTLTIGVDYVDSSGKIGKLKPGKKEHFYIEPNSIVYVSTAEMLNLPAYIAARFNLRVKWVYKGVLLGTGPQVEPGFIGYLSCPLFNLTDKAVKVRLGDEFATIDFERTSDFLRKGETWESVVQTRTYISANNTHKVTTRSGEFLLFPQNVFRPLKHLPDYDVVSSLQQMENEVKLWRNIGISLILAFFALTITLLSFQHNLYRELRSTATELSTVKADLAATKVAAKSSDSKGK